MTETPTLTRIVDEVNPTNGVYATRRRRLLERAIQSAA